MKRLTTQLARLDALSFRERSILFVLLLAVLWGLANVLVLTPLERFHKSLQDKVVEARATLAQTQEELARQAAQPDPTVLARQRLEKARKDLAERLKMTSELQKHLVSPKDMVRVLQGLLANQPGVHLLQLNTLPPVPLGPAPGAKDGHAPALFKHGVEITVSGDYAALTRYMTVIEGLPAGFYWERATLDASRHPAIELTLTLNTLSLDKTWLSL